METLIGTKEGIKKVNIKLSEKAQKELDDLREELNLPDIAKDIRVWTKMGIEEHYLKKIESWFIMLNTPENDNYDSGMVRDEMKEFLVSEYKDKIGAS